MREDTGRTAQGCDCSQVTSAWPPGSTHATLVSGRSWGAGTEPRAPWLKLKVPETPRRPGAAEAPRSYAGAGGAGGETMRTGQWPEGPGSTRRWRQAGWRQSPSPPTHRPAEGLTQGRHSLQADVRRQLEGISQYVELLDLPRLPGVNSPCDLKGPGVPVLSRTGLQEILCGCSGLQLNEELREETAARPALRRTPSLAPAAHQEPLTPPFGLPTGVLIARLPRTLSAAPVPSIWPHFHSRPPTCLERRPLPS